MLQERTAGAVACASSVQQPRVDSNSEVLFMLSQKIQDLDDALDVRLAPHMYFMFNE